MCFGCMSYEGATGLVEKQLDFLYKSEEEQKQLMAQNEPNDGEYDLLNYSANVSNLLPIHDWSKDKVSIYFYVATGAKGTVAQFTAVKLLILYEQWAKNNDETKYKEYQEMLQKNKEQRKEIDKVRLEKEQKESEIQLKEYEIKCKERKESTTRSIGINTIGQSLGRSNYNLRTEPAVPIHVVSPWLQTSISPDINLKPLEIKHKEMALTPSIFSLNYWWPNQ
jgi:hypothetical protein